MSFALDHRDTLELGLVEQEQDLTHNIMLFQSDPSWGEGVRESVTVCDRGGSRACDVTLINFLSYI